MGAEQDRLEQHRQNTSDWKKWGPYLSERQWGTVREDYSDHGDAWNYFTHDQARSRAYRWGEDGLGGLSDDAQRLCFSLALWNGKDPILKERLFGLTNSESNHGEDVKEYYYYLDSTPTHSWMKFLYKYPQRAFPYCQLVERSRSRGRQEFEYELLDTGVFDDNRYFDVVVEYAKGSADSFLIRITAHNRGPVAAPIDLLPTVWFRNIWSTGGEVARPSIEEISHPLGRAVRSIEADSRPRWMIFEGDPELLFTDNETNTRRLFNRPNQFPFVKDGINEHVVNGRPDAINPARRGTKAAARYRRMVEPGQSTVVRIWWGPEEWTEPNVQKASEFEPFGAYFEATMRRRELEADEFYATVIPPSLDPDSASIMRQALAGMLWSKQYYEYDVHRWLSERGSDPFSRGRQPSPRNDHWHHMRNGDILSMPDKWEYPWYAAWDLAFHVIAFALIDPDFGKSQLQLMLSERYLHPNGQIPAYEWNFGDVNPPVHAWSTIYTYRLDKAARGEADVAFLKSSFQKLLLNFTWWVNRKDRTGRNVFEGGFLGLDNIGVFDRSAPLPTGGCLEQADGTAWMVLYCENMLEISSELALHDRDDGEMTIKFVEHFLWIASAMIHLGDDTGMWDDQDGFFYDVLRLPDGTARRLKVRSMVGLLPLCAATVFEGDLIRKYPDIGERLTSFLDARPVIRSTIHDPRQLGPTGRRLGSILNEEKLRRVLAKMLDEEEFLSAFGIRSLSRYHRDHPYILHVEGREYRVDYLPAESDNGMFGGNSNWRGPIWMPMNVLIIRALMQYYLYYGDTFKVECPTGSGVTMTLYQVAEEIARRIGNIFRRGADGTRPVFGGSRPFQDDPYWRDHLLFYEYFHGDNGAGLGASHQTGWTGCVASLLHLFATLSAEEILASGKNVFTQSESFARQPAATN